MRGVPRLRKDLEALKRLTEGGVPPRRWLRDMKQAVAYLMYDAIVLGFRIGRVVSNQDGIGVRIVYYSLSGEILDFQRGGKLDGTHI